MSLVKRLAAGALSFAHLAALNRPTQASTAPAAAAAEEDKDDERKKRDDETDEEHAARVKKLDDDAKAAEENKDDEEEEERKQREAAAAAATAEALAAAEARGATAERARGAAIFASPAAARNVALAAELAFGCDWPAERCVALLAKTPAPAMHTERAARNPVGAASTAPAVTPAQALAARWDQHLQAARGGKR